ncbi:MAG: TRC40/GET3/ArsA family transport-energizing ATPase [Synergistaceae bacterium]|jgi:arsenite-transporting ATPase|nr:TRC40/GET3/ArsA family transport-energizing ATPase [Synergistaceae bacterium]
MTIRPFTFFGGKGGTGKTTCSAAYALALARRGIATLLVSTDPAHSLSDIVDTALGNDVRPICENLWGLEIDAEAEAKRYIGEIQDKMLSIVSAAIVDEIKRQMEIAYTSPGAEEAAAFDKFVELMDKQGDPYEAIVFDTAPTGHTLRLLSLPEILGAWIESLIAKRRKSLELFKMAGRFEEDLMKRAANDPVIESLTRRQQRFEKSRKYLINPESSAFFFVLNAERMPILETSRAVALLEKFGIVVGGVVVNRVIPPEAGDFFAARLTAQEGYLRDIEERFGGGGRKLVHLPLLRFDVRGMEQVSEVANLIGGIDA